MLVFNYHFVQYAPRNKIKDSIKLCTFKPYKTFILASYEAEKFSKKVNRNSITRISIRVVKKNCNFNWILVFSQINYGVYGNYGHIAIMAILGIWP